MTNERLIAEITREMKRNGDMTRAMVGLGTGSLFADSSARSLDDVLARVKSETARRQAEYNSLLESEKLRARGMIDEDMLFRFDYIPFSLAELAWDYADTVVDMAIVQRDGHTKKLARTVRHLRREYIKHRAQGVNDERQKGELENAHHFEDYIEDDMNKYVMHLRTEITSRNPGLTSDSVMLVVSVWQCYVILQALFLYVERERRAVSLKIGHNVGDIFPKHIRVLGDIILEFAGNVKLSKRFIDLQQQYIKTFASSIDAIEINPITTDGK